ncbi:MAG TPA: M28 family peptidase [Thermoanaerobaculia bacterium]|nr:M28 family peptidase [Thermoanaerobaculia bacterium]
MLRRLLLLLVLGGAAASGGAAIDPGEIRASIHLLTSPAFEGRGTGTAGGDRAARYIAAEFRSAGLRPLGTSRANDPDAPLDGTGYFQPFVATVGGDLGPANSLSARWARRRTEYRLDDTFVPSTLSGSGSARGPVVFAGYGVVSRAAARDDYGSRDVSGRIVLLLAGSPAAEPDSPLALFAGIFHKVLFARDKGAAAVVVAAPDDSDPARWNTNRGFSDEGLPVLLVTRHVADEWLGAAGWSVDAVRRELATRAWPLDLPVTAELSTDIRPRRRPTANVAGLLEGSDPSRSAETVVVGAHFDHLGLGGPNSLAADRRPAIHPGADDNASGTAGLIALAHAFAAGPRPRRSVLFVAFSGEELGLLGSGRYVRHPLVPLERTVAMVNMDMIGRLRDDRLAVIGTGSSPEWPELLSDLNRQARFRLVFASDPYGGSDQQSFYLAEVPVLFFFTGKHPEYHTPADREETIDDSGEARVLELVRRCVGRIADEPARPAFRDLDPSAAHGSRAAFGIVPDYASEVSPGVAVARTSAGSAAQRAGVRTGDVIVAFGGHAIRTLHDLRIVLSELAPGEAIPVRVRRGGSEIALSATLPAPPPAAPAAVAAPRGGER